MLLHRWMKHTHTYTHTGIQTDTQASKHYASIYTNWRNIPFLCLPFFQSHIMLSRFHSHIYIHVFSCLLILLYNFSCSPHPLVYIYMFVRMRTQFIGIDVHVYACEPTNTYVCVSVCMSACAVTKAIAGKREMSGKKQWSASCG